MRDRLLYKPSEAAERLGISRQQMRRLMATRQVRYVVVGRGRTGIVSCRRIAREDLDAFVERRSSAGG
jgi:excisionase family DNA binding protein